LLEKAQRERPKARSGRAHEPSCRPQGEDPSECPRPLAVVEGCEIVGWMVEQPVGTVTMVFTDIQGSTRMLERLGGERYRELLAQHHVLVRDLVGRFGGYEVDTEGDAFFVAFGRAHDAVAAAAEIQRALGRTEWPEGLPLRVRMGIHTGEPLVTPPRYVGLDVHRAARIAAAAHGGQVVVSPVTAGLLGDGGVEGVRLLDLGLHRLKDLSEPQRLFQLAGDGLEERFPPLRTLERRQTNLPVQTTSFVGRERELAEVVALLAEPDSRLVTLTGTGGTGKTRLALHAAGSQIDEFADGVFVVFLAAVREPDDVVSAVAQALGLLEQAGETLAETLGSFLGERELLLVLDNFEQVVEAAPLLARWMAAATGLRLLVTSRVALRLSNEIIYDVHPLKLPANRAGEPVRLAESEAALLFVARARAARPDFAITDENAAAVADICARLDGLPLALELAAARARVLSPQALLARLDRRLGLLTGGARDLDARQQTMAAAIAWSYDLLDLDEQQLFARLGVFVGGFRVDAAEAVVAAHGEAPLDPFDGLSSLVEKSLLVERDDGDAEPRFLMLETLREYALERLDGSGEAAAIADAHARHFLALAEEAASHWEGKERERWVSRLAADHANLDAALAALHKTDPEAEMGLAAALADYWDGRCLWAEGRERLVASLSHGDRSPTRARALLADGWLANEQGLYDQAADRAKEAAALAAELGDQVTRAQVRHLQAWVAYYRDDAAEAEAAAEEALDLLPQATHIGSTLRIQRLLSALAAEHGNLEEARVRYEAILATTREHADQLSIAQALDNLGNTERMLGNFERAHELLAEAVELGRTISDRNVLAHALGNLAHVERMRGDTATARRVADESVEIRRSLGAKHGLAMALHARAQAAFTDGDMDRARTDTQDALCICGDLGDRQGIATTLEQLGSIAVADHDPRTAVLLIGAAQAIREAIGFPPTEERKTIIADAIRQAEVEIGRDAARDLQAEGVNLPLAQAVERALALQGQIDLDASQPMEAAHRIS
jgi:predicted ATPase/class 3 adenylate cyclase